MNHHHPHDCQNEHHPHGPCGHLDVSGAASPCHRSGLMPCPSHFAQQSGLALMYAVPDSQRTPLKDFATAVQHLNSDGMLVSAFYTWMAMVGRYTVPDGKDPLETLDSIEEPNMPAGAPLFVDQVFNLTKWACRAAVLGDGETVAASLAAANAEETEPRVLLSFLMSAAATAHIAAEVNDACTSQHIGLFQTLGSQVGDADGMVVLPLLVDMVYAYQHRDEDTAVQALEKLVELPGTAPLVAAVDVLGRTLGQLTDENVTMAQCTSKGMPQGKLEVEGMVNLQTATAENTDSAVMAGVWALRTAHAYGNATSQKAANHAVQALADRHGQPVRFAVDVVMAATQMLSEILEVEASQPG